MSAERRFLVPAGSLLDDGGSTVIVEGAEHHHLSRVLRLEPGDAVSLFDGTGRGFTGVIESIGRLGTRVRLEGKDERPVEPRLSLVLAQGIPHHDKMELVIQKCTEVGVAVIAPILAARSVPRPGEESGARRLERWRRVAAEAARQSGRLRIPEIAPPVPWRTFLEGVGGDAPPCILLSPSGIGPLLDWSLALRGARAAIVAIGPEGGWTAEEEGLALGRGFRAASLGSRVLRAETAAIVAAALALHAAGDLAPRAPQDPEEP